MQNVISAVREFVLFALMSEKTPTKPVRKRGGGRKPKKEIEASDFCRVCKTNFKNQGTYVSSENLFTTSKDYTPLYEIVTESLKLSINSASNLSTRVCKKCALKIRNAASNLNFVMGKLNVPHEHFIENVAEDSAEENEGQVRFKRLSKSPSSRTDNRRKAEGEAATTSLQSSRSAKPPLSFGICEDKALIYYGFSEASW